MTTQVSHRTVFYLLTGLVGVATYARGRDFGQGFSKVILVIIILLLIGGIAGALAASRIVYGPWQEHLFAIEGAGSGKTAVVATEIQVEVLVGVGGHFLAIEHYAFWLALLIAILAFARPYQHLPISCGGRAISITLVQGFPLAVVRARW